MTKHECAVVMAYTGVCMLTGDSQKHFYKYVAKLIGRPVYTHEMPGLAETIKEKAKQDFLELCRTATEMDGGAEE